MMLPLEPLVRLWSMSKQQENLKDAKIKDFWIARVEVVFTLLISSQGSCSCQYQVSKSPAIKLNYKEIMHSKEKLRRTKFSRYNSDPKAIVNTSGFWHNRILNEVSNERSRLRGIGIIAVLDRRICTIPKTSSD